MKRARKTGIDVLKRFFGQNPPVLGVFRWFLMTQTRGVRQKTSLLLVKKQGFWPKSDFFGKKSKIASIDFAIFVILRALNKSINWFRKDKKFWVKKTYFKKKPIWIRFFYAEL